MFRAALWLITNLAARLLGHRSVSLQTTAVTSADVVAPIVDLGYAQYQGYFNAQTNITEFLGIRYAAPPLGYLRFQAPQAPVRESGIQPATQNPETCYQTPMGANTTVSVASREYNKRQSTTPAASEDCLFLNVFVPGTMPGTPASTDKLPVLVWIHGGGYQSGYAAQYNGNDLIAESKNNVIVVVIQYRLGVFGFLSGDEIEAHGALNAGLLDQTFALQWVQEHIGLFGGDKGHVTIWGESAGAGSVLQHIVANGGNTEPPLFNAAIVNSVYLPSQYHYTDRVPQSLYSKVVSMTGCASSAESFACLQSIDAEILQTVNRNLSISASFGTFIFVPVVDGTFILDRPTITLAKGQMNGQVLLAMSNQNEGNMFVDANEALKITDYISQLFPDMTPPQLWEAAYVYQSHGTAREQAIEVMGDSIFVCPTYYLLRAFAGRSWKGLFAVPPAYHGSDVKYYFNSPSSPPSYNNPQFIAAFAGSFMSLAKSYDVNIEFDSSNTTPFWDKYDVEETEMLFNHTEAGVPLVMPIKTDSTLHERCAFWSSVTHMTAQ